MIFVLVAFINAEHDNDEITVWSFRNDNVNNINVKAYYTGPKFTKSFGDYSICFRYKVLYFNTNANGVKIITGNSKRERFDFIIYNEKSPNVLRITTEEGKYQIFFFNAEIVLR